MCEVPVSLIAATNDNLFLLQQTEKTRGNILNNFPSDRVLTVRKAIHGFKVMLIS